MKELGDISELFVGMSLIDTENENKEVKVTNLSANSVEMWLLKDTRWYDLEVTCDKCGKKHRIINSDRSKKFLCNNLIVINKEGKDFTVTCGSKNYTEQKKEYTGIDASQWFQYEKWFKERFKKIN